jgi:hypothetical protein
MAHAHYIAGQFDEPVTRAKKALAQNPRFAIALRYLAASLAKLGKSEDTAEVMRDIRRYEPQLTLSLLRKRLMFMEESVWQKFADGLRLAGLPE